MINFEEEAIIPKHSDTSILASNQDQRSKTGVNMKIANIQNQKLQATSLAKLSKHDEKELKKQAVVLPSVAEAMRGEKKE